MKLQEFMEEVKAAVKMRVGKEVEIYPVLKNNDTTYHGLVILEPVLNVAPTIYIEPFFHRYMDGQGFDEIIDDIISTFEKHQLTKDFDVSFFVDWDKAKSRITMKLINTWKNQKLLEKIPHVPFYDLSIVFMVDVSQTVQERATILIYNHHLKLWNVTVEEIHKLALENTPRQLQPRLDDLHDVFEYITGESLQFLKELNIKILTNHLHIHGATCIAYPDLLKELYDTFEDNVIIMPSSVHEVLVFPEKNMPDGYELNYLSDMVRCVNRNDLANEEMLNDHVYRFNGTELEFIG